MLEPCNAKVLRTVLRGLGASNRAWLLGRGGARSDRASHRTLRPGKLPTRFVPRGNDFFSAQSEEKNTETCFQTSHERVGKQPFVLKGVDRACVEADGGQR